MPYQSIWSTIELGNLSLKNRMALAPMTRTSASENGVPTERMTSYYANFAHGGFGLLISEGTYPDESHSQGYSNQPGIANPAHVDGWKAVTGAVHEQGSLILCQLMHAGALSQGNYYKKDTIAPSAVKPKGEQLSVYGGQGEFPIPREMTKQDIKEVIHHFAQAAVRARDAGFDGVEVHGANGYLLDQFLSEYTNQRTDEYGGSTQNRVRLINEVLHAVREAVGSNFVVGVRISQGKINDYEYKWSNGESDVEIIFSSISETKPDFIHVTEYDAMNPAFGEEGFTLAQLAKKHGKVPVIANGQLENPKKAEDLIQKGDADIISIGKGALANPDWTNRVKQGESLKTFDFDVLQPDATIKDKELLSFQEVR
jgi:2,4-dienoyl-CoA reductase-like NADH-dependent reductase (Old Yellow Enzyme family)